VCYFVSIFALRSSACSALNGGAYKFISGTGKVTSGYLTIYECAADGAPSLLLSSITFDMISFELNLNPVNYVG